MNNYYWDCTLDNSLIFSVSLHVQPCRQGLQMTAGMTFWSAENWSGTVSGSSFLIIIICSFYASYRINLFWCLDILKGWFNSCILLLGLNLDDCDLAAVVDTCFTTDSNMKAMPPVDSVCILMYLCIRHCMAGAKILIKQHWWRFSLTAQH